MGRSWLMAMLLAGCYQPTPSRDVPCGPGGACPSGQTCVSERCVAENTVGADGPSDTSADSAIDAAPVDGTSVTGGDAQGDAMPDAMPVVIAWQSTTTAKVVQAGAVSVTVARPTCATGDVFVATVAMGRTNSATKPTFTAPTGWTLVRRVDRLNDTALATYWHTAGATEPATYTWQLGATIEGVAWISCYAHVDPISPIEIDAGALVATAGPMYAAPSITTTTPNAMVLATFVSHAATATTWSVPTGTTARASLNNATTRSGLGVDKLFALAGATGTLTATASTVQDYALVETLALKPAP